MLKSCSYCGKIHDRRQPCGAKPMRDYKNEYKYADKERTLFRGSAEWKNKREQIKQRDSYCCQVCLVSPAPNARRYNTDKISVHHIESLSRAWGKRLDDSNLITLCSYHHQLADTGKIEKSFLRELIKKIIPPGV